MRLLIPGSVLAIILAVALAPGSGIPDAYADLTATVSMPAGSSIQGCEETDECFIPADVSVDVGGEVTWSNDDTAAHTVTSGTQADGSDGNFDSGLFLAGTTFSHTFDEAGEYPYFCLVHPWAVGSVTVVGDDIVLIEDGDENNLGDAPVVALIEQLWDLVNGYQAEIQRLTDSVEYWRAQAADTEYVVERMEVYRQENEVLKSQNHNSTRILELEAERDDLADRLNTTSVRYADMWERNNRLDMENQLNAIRVQTLQDEVDRLNVLLESNTNINPGPVTMQTDQSRYGPGDTIVVTGQVPYIEDGYSQIRLQTYRPDGALVNVDQLFVRSDGTFATSLNAGGSLWNENGMYTIRAEYGSAPATGETTFEFEAEEEITPEQPIPGDRFFRSANGLTFEVYPKQHIYGLYDHINVTATMVLDSEAIERENPKRYDLNGNVVPLNGRLKVNAPEVGDTRCIFEYNYTNIVIDYCRDQYNNRHTELPYFAMIDGMTLTISDGYPVIGSITSGLHYITSEYYVGYTDVEINEVIEIGHKSNPPMITARVTIPTGVSGQDCARPTHECLIPKNVTINAGDIVVWYNDDNMTHSIFSGPFGKEVRWFDIEPGEAVHRTFDEPGEYRYSSARHGMPGTITVN